MQLIERGIPISSYVAAGQGSAAPMAERATAESVPLVKTPAGDWVFHFYFSSSGSYGYGGAPAVLHIERLIADASGLRRVVVLDSLGRSDLSVISPFYLEVHVTPEDVNVIHRPSGVFGIGDTEIEALADFRASVAELFDTLETQRAHLGPAMSEVHVVLSSMIRAL